MRIVNPRAATRRRERPARRTLKTGYCDRKIDVTDKRNSNSDIQVRDVNFSESEISGILGRDGPTTESKTASGRLTFERRVRSWLRMNAGGAPNTCKSNG